MNIEKLKQIYETESSITATARKYAELEGISFDDSFRRKCSKYLNNSGVIDNDLGNSTTTDTNQYKSEISNMPSAWSFEKKRFYTIEEYCDVYGLDKNSVKSSKLVSHNASHMVYNIAFFTDEEEAILDVDNHLEEIIQKYITPIKTGVKNEIDNSKMFDRLVYTDTHISMDVNGKDGDPMYEGKWDRNETLKRLTDMISHVKTFKSSKTINFGFLSIISEVT